MIWLRICLVIKTLNPRVTELFVKGRKLNISFVFITQSYFAVLKNIRLNLTHYFIVKIPTKRQVQQIAFDPSWDNDFQHFMNLYKKIDCKTLFGTTLSSGNLSRFRKNLLERI